MIIRYPLLALLAIAAGSLAVPAMAQDAVTDEYQVSGEILDVMPDQDRIRLRVEDADDPSRASAGDVATYELSADTEIRRRDIRRSVRPVTPMTLGDLRRGDLVTLHIQEIEGRQVARAVEATDNGEATAAADSTTMEDDTAADRTVAAADRDEEEQTEAAAMEARRDALPATASPMPLLALAGLGFAGAALVLRYRRR